MEAQVIEFSSTKQADKDMTQILQTPPAYPTMRELERFLRQGESDLHHDAAKSSERRVQSLVVQLSTATLFRSFQWEHQ